jgi:hypothetical protein
MKLRHLKKFVYEIRDKCENKMRSIALDLEGKRGVFLNISEESNFSKHFRVISTLD